MHKGNPYFIGIPRILFTQRIHLIIFHSYFISMAKESPRVEDGAPSKNSKEEHNAEIFVLRVAEAPNVSLSMSDAHFLEAKPLLQPNDRLHSYSYLCIGNL